VEGSVQRQVFIQAKIIEVTLNDDYKLGIDWKQVSPFSIGKTDGFLVANTTITGAAAANFTYGPSATATSLILDALSEQGEVRVLSSPKIATLNNQRAVIKVGTEDIFLFQKPQRRPQLRLTRLSTSLQPSPLVLFSMLFRKSIQMARL
jgi:MSHA biogenesis protein MshL